MSLDDPNERKRRREEEKERRKREKSGGESRITKMTIPGYCGWRGGPVFMVFMVLDGKAAAESE